MFAYQIQEIANLAKETTKLLYAYENERIDFSLDLALLHYELKENEDIDLDFIESQLLVLNTALSEVTGLITSSYEQYENYLYQIENFNFYENK